MDGTVYPVSIRGLFSDVLDLKLLVKASTSSVKSEDGVVLETINFSSEADYVCYHVNNNFTGSGI